MERWRQNSLDLGSDILPLLDLKQSSKQTYNLSIILDLISVWLGISSQMPKVMHMHCQPLMRRASNTQQRWNMKWLSARFHCSGICIVHLMSKQTLFHSENMTSWLSHIMVEIWVNNAYQLSTSQDFSILDSTSVWLGTSGKVLKVMHGQPLLGRASNTHHLWNEPVQDFIVMVSVY